MGRANDNDLELSTLTVTRYERVLIAKALVMAYTIIDACGDDARELLELHSRVMPEGEL